MSHGNMTVSCWVRFTRWRKTWTHFIRTSCRKQSGAAQPGPTTTKGRSLSGPSARCYLAGMRSVAEQVNQLAHFDAVIHNAGVGYPGGTADQD